MNNNVFFSYKIGNSIIHKLPSWIKILLFPIYSILIFKMEIKSLIIIFAIQVCLAFSIKFTLKDQFKDLKIIFLYSFLLYISNFISSVSNISFQNIEAKLFFLEVKNIGILILKNKKNYLLLLKLFCTMQFSSIIFRTSSTLQLRNGISIIEDFIKKIFFLKTKKSFSMTIFLFLNFIPLSAKIWNQIKNTYLIRGGKKSPLLIIKLSICFFSVGLKKSYNLAKALYIRSETL